MITAKINGTLTMGTDSTLTLRVWLTDRQREDFVIETGKYPGQLKTIVMDGGKMSIDEYIKLTKGSVEVE